MRLRLALLTLFALTIAGSASAQTVTSTAGVTVSVLDFEGRTTANIKSKPLNIDECARDIPIEFRISGLPSGNPVLTVFKGTSCESGNARLGSNGTAKTCTEITHLDVTSGATQLDVTFSAADLACDGGKFETLNIYFMRLMTAESAEEVTAFGAIQLQVDTTAPPAPTDVTGSSGETAIPVDWSFDGTDVDHFLVYWDPESDGCSSAILVEGEDVDATDTRLGKDRASAGEDTLALSGAAEIGQELAVGVIAVDKAGNRSVLSNIGCITGVKTYAWPELHAAQGGKLGDTCAVASMTQGHTATFSLWAMLMLFLGLRAVRRRS